MAQLSTAQWGYITGDVSSFAYRPTYGVDDVVYNKTEYLMAASTKHGKFQNRPYKVVRVAYRSNAAGAPLKNSDGTAITSAVVSQATAPWVYDIKEILVGETVATASGPITQGVIESDLATLAGLRTYIESQDDNWSDPAAS